MAALCNARGSLRFSLELAALETPELPRRSELSDPAAEKLRLRILGEASAPPRVLGRVSVDFFDRRDESFWPFVRQAVLWLGPSDATDLGEGLGRLLRDEVPGFSFQSAGKELALQCLRLEAASAAATVYAIEVGIDLARPLDEASGPGHLAGEALSLFRFSAGRPQMVAFAQSLREELAALHGEGTAARK